MASVRLISMGLTSPRPTLPSNSYTQSQFLTTPHSLHSGITTPKGQGSVKKGPKHLRRAGPALAYQVTAWAGTVGNTSWASGNHLEVWRPGVQQGTALSGRSVCWGLPCNLPWSQSALNSTMWSMRISSCGGLRSEQRKGMDPALYKASFLIMFSEPEKYL